jgi:hypothetical protein
MNDNIDFGTIGVKIGDTIVFEGNKNKYKVGSGAGVPGNGGTLIQWATGELRSIKSATRILMGDDFSEESDLFSMWTFKGRTLRELHDQNRERNKTDSKTIKAKKNCLPFDIAITTPSCDSVDK